MPISHFEIAEVRCAFTSEELLPRNESVFVLVNCVPYFEDLKLCDLTFIEWTSYCQ